MNLNKSLLRILPLLGLLLLSQPGFAAPVAPREKPIEIESNSADLDKKSGVSVYRGDVVMTQGSTRITGDTITIYTAQDEVTKVVAEGKKNRAYFEELQPNEQGLLQAWANTINYDLKAEQINLLKNAELKQKGDTFKGETIEYNISQQTVNARSETGEGSTNRVQMVIHPKQK